MGDLRGIRDKIRAMSLREAVRLVLKGYDDRDLLTFASALASASCSRSWYLTAIADYGSILDAILQDRVDG